VVATAALALFIGPFPIVVSTFGTFAPVFGREFHAGRGAISLAFAIHNFVGTALSLSAGRLADRFGSRAVPLGGSAILVLLLFSASALGSGLWQLYAFYAALGAVGAFTNAIPYR
jgi:MFS family permease